MEFYLGKNKLDEEFSITDYCSIHEEEFHLLRDSKAIARFYKEEDSLNRIVLYLHYEIEPITKYTGNFDTLDEFLELRFLFSAKGLSIFVTTIF